MNAPNAAAPSPNNLMRLYTGGITRWANFWCHRHGVSRSPTVLTTISQPKYQNRSSYHIESRKVNNGRGHQQPQSLFYVVCLRRTRKRIKKSFSSRRPDSDQNSQADQKQTEAQDYDAGEYANDFECVHVRNRLNTANLTLKPKARNKAVMTGESVCGRVARVPTEAYWSVRDAFLFP